MPYTWSSPSPGTLVVFDRVSLAEVRPRIQVGGVPEQVVVNPTAGRIYVVNRGSASYSITVIGLESLQVESEIPIGFGLVAARSWLR